ncbi:hypothetical protein L210DRAFT_3576056, partial [Boletus edulis BED1]
MSMRHFLWTMLTVCAGINAYWLELLRESPTASFRQRAWSPAFDIMPTLPKTGGIYHKVLPLLPRLTDQNENDRIAHGSGHSTASPAHD